MCRKTVAFFLILILLSLSFTGCFGKTKANEPFSMPITDEPQSLDPQIADSNAERLVASNCYEGLVRVAADGSIQNGVATNYTVSADGLVYTFTLRRDAQWALFTAQKSVLGEKYGEKEFKEKFDKTVRAEDFVFALRRAVDPQTGSQDAFLFSAVANAKDIMAGRAPVASLGVRATDDFTVEITLEHTDENLLYALTAPAAMPCDEEFFALTNGRYGLEAGYTLCNGPLHISRWTEKTSLKMVRNDDYHGDMAVKPASLTLYYNDDGSKIPEKMASGTYDAAFLTKAQYENLSDTSALTVQSLENTVYSFLFHPQNSVLANENLRKALCLSADLEKTELSGEGVTRATGLVPPYCRIGAGTYRTQSGAAMLPYNAEQAKFCFSEALLELGASSAELEVLCEEAYADFVRAVVQGWQKTLGVKFVASVKSVSADALQAAVTDGNYEIVFYPLTADSVMTSVFLEMFGNGGKFGVDSAEYAQKLSAVRGSAGNFTALRTACTEAENYLLQHAFLLPVLWEGNYFVTSKDTKDIYFYSSKDYVYFIYATKK